MAVSKRLRFEILRRDNHACRYCGAASPDVKLTVDHVVPTALGGSDDPSNLVAACVGCNGGKSSMPADAAMVDDVAADALRWSQAMQRAADIERERRNDQRRFALDFIDRVVVIIREDPEEMTYCMPDLKSPCVGGLDGLVRTLSQFRECGLDLDDLVYAIKRTGLNHAIDDQVSFKYFCGICWRMIEDRQAAARAILEMEEVDERG